MSLNEKQFKALCQLRLISGKRQDSPSTQALREVLVEGMEPLKAAENHGLTHQAVYLTLSRSRECIENAKILSGAEA